MFLFVHRVNRALCADCWPHEVVSQKKTHYCFDYGGNVLRHGCIDDVTVKAKGEGTGEAPAKEMPSIRAKTILHAAARERPGAAIHLRNAPRAWQKIFDKRL